MILRTEKLTKRFAGLKAVSTVNLQVAEGEIHAIIGPNGAGKTTLFNMLTGEIEVSAGDIYFNEKKITGLKPNQIARAGIGRSFQQNKLFQSISVLENVRLAVHAHSEGHFNPLLHFLSYTKPIEKAWKILEELDISSIAHKEAGELSHGQQRMLEVAIALAAEPAVLLLDEPTSGMSPEGAFRMIRMLEKIGDRLTMVLIEHNMNLVMSISSKITVLQQGEVIATGNPSEIKNNEVVRRAYLGEYSR